MATMKITLTDGSTAEVDFPEASDIDWSEEGSFLIFRGDKGKTVGFNRDVVVRFDVTEKWGK